MTAPIPRGHYRPPVQPPAPQPLPPGEPRALTTLRACAYVCTTVASVLFTVMVIYGYVKLMEFQAAMEELSRSFPTFTPPPR